MNEALPFAAAVALSGGLAIWGRHPRRLLVHWLCKPLPTLLLALAVWCFSPSVPPKPWVIAGLLLSLCGDVLLMLPMRYFVLGLISFLLALVTYAVGFSIGVPVSLSRLLLVAIPLCAAGWVVRLLWTHLGRLRPAVLLYVLAMVVMASRLLMRFDTPGVSWASFVWGAAGGLMFVTADSLLAVRRFVGSKIPYALELGVYFASQWCLAAATWT